MSYIMAGADIEEGGLPPQGFDPLPTQRVPLCTMLRYPYSVTDPKKFLKAPSATIYTKFEGGGGGAPKKRDFFVKIFQKMPFCHVFFSKFCL